MDGDGGTALTPGPTRAHKFRAVGPGEYTQVVSPTVVVKPKVYLGAPVAPLTIKEDVSFVVDGAFKPRHSPGWNKAVKLYCYRKNLLTGRAYAPEDARHAATWSASTYRTVK